MVMMMIKMMIFIMMMIKEMQKYVAIKVHEKKGMSRIFKMFEDEKYQREAFKALLLHQDDRVLEITDQTVCPHNCQDEKVV